MPNYDSTCIQPSLELTHGKPDVKKHLKPAGP